MKKFQAIFFVSAMMAFAVQGHAQESAAQPATVATPVAATPATVPASDAPSPISVETIVCVRHGERLSDVQHHDYGQLTPQGLNRALALPNVLLTKFGKPQFIFAPNPGEFCQSMDGSTYCYVRAFASIEPTAILCGLPVNTQFGYRDIQALESELRKPAYENALVFMAWEHS